ncbi:hypothetical protein MA16_Dca009974 [Dendrobium catenatum]|uniref:Uncharacterized protein n=1 Tax=Dendrobium catenatum TaxID=906689 RepID=A0A2I0WDC4_9ASPA|nr:hypothetical protein MA16_Dca009974 [Dendrobium catenatum]
MLVEKGLPAQNNAPETFPAYYRRIFRRKNISDGFFLRRKFKKNKKKIKYKFYSAQATQPNPHHQPKQGLRAAHARTSGQTSPPEL